LHDALPILTVEPGFGGQKFLDGCLPKIARTRQAISASGLEIRLQVDGGVSASTIERGVDAGADVLVAGSAVYGAEDAAAAISRRRSLAAAHTHGPIRAPKTRCPKRGADGTARLVEHPGIRAAGQARALFRPVRQHLRPGHRGAGAATQHPVLAGADPRVGAA